MTRDPRTFSPLAGIQVIDATSARYALCKRILRELGAVVVSVECPEQIAGAGVHASAIIEDYPPGRMDQAGGYPAIAAMNPGIVMVSITGYGLDGPRRDWTACDLSVASLGGWTCASGDPGKPPLPPWGSQSYHVGSLFAVNALLLALRHRDKGGPGQHVDISLQECVAATLDHVLVQYLAQGEVWQRRGGSSWNDTFRILPCRGGHILVSLSSDPQTLTEWLTSEGVTGGAGMLEDWTRTRTASELFEKAQLLHMPWAPVTDIDDLAANPQLEARGFFTGEGSLHTARVLPWVVRKSSPVPKERVMPASHPSPLPLSNVRILDFSWVLAGPYATRLLADFGAQVIKVQSAQVPGTREGNLTPYFSVWNRNKLSISLDASRPQGAELVRRLVRISDIVVESFSPRVMSNWGLGYEDLRLVRPDLIMLSMSAFGHTGPWRDYVGFGPTIHALSGLTYLTSYDDAQPVGPGFSLSDHVAGLFGSLAVLAALERRHRTGPGCHIDLSQFESMSALVALSAGQCLDRGTIPQPEGDRDCQSQCAPHGIYRCRGDDRWCAISAGDDNAWARTCHALEMPEFTRDPRFMTIGNRTANRDALDRTINTVTARMTAEEVAERLQSAGVCAGVVNDAAGLARDPQLLERRFLVEMRQADSRRVLTDASPIRMPLTPASYRRAAPALGQDNDYVFGELLGMKKEEIQHYVRDGTIY